MNGNADRLREAGLIADTPLPDRYYEVIEQMTPDEVEALVSLRQRLVDAGIVPAPLTAPPPAMHQSIVIL